MAVRSDFLYHSQHVLKCVDGHLTRLNGGNFDSVRTEQWFIDYLKIVDDERKLKLAVTFGSHPLDDQAAREIYLEMLQSLHKLATECDKVRGRFPAADRAAGYEFVVELNFMFRQPLDEHHERHTRFGGRLIRS